MALLGVTPTSPSEKYGYILSTPSPSNSIKSYSNVLRFVEKPNKKLAEKLIEQTALWNCGVFAFKMKFLLSVLQSKNMPIEYEELLRRYQELPQISFDYEVVEKTERIVVKPYSGCWKDLGTWSSLTEEIDSNIIGKGFVSQESRNSHLINELSIPIVIQGLPNVIVAASPDGILVSDKAESDHIKPLITRFNSRPMFEERRWGSYRVLDYESFGQQKVLTKRLSILADRNLSYQTHEKREEVWTVVKGEGLFAHEDRIEYVKPGSVLQIPIGTKHAIKALTDMEIIEVQTGVELVEEDIHRICMTWEETEKRATKGEGDDKYKPI